MTKNNNKSLFLYTALIFVVAIVLIVIAFFGQEHAAMLSRDEAQDAAQSVKVTLKPSEPLNSSISQRAAALSDENAVLLQENKELKTENESVKTELDAYKKDADSARSLAKAYALASRGDFTNASTAIGTVVYEELDEDAKTLYDGIKKMIDGQ